MVRAHQGLPTWHHPNRLWGRVDYHLPDEEPHVFHPDHEEAAGNCSQWILFRLSTIHTQLIGSETFLLLHLVQHF